MPSQADLLASIKDPQVRARLEQSMKGTVETSREVTHVLENPLQFATDIARNAALDVGDVFKAITSIPELAKQIYDKPIDTASAIVKAFFGSYSDLIQHPLSTIGKRPITAPLDIIGAAGVISKGARIAGAAAVASGKAGPIATMLKGAAQRGRAAERIVAENMLSSIYGDLAEREAEYWHVAKNAKKALKKLPADTGERLIAAMENSRYWNDGPTATADMNMDILRQSMGPALDVELPKLRHAFDAHRIAMNDAGWLLSIPKLEQYITHLFEPGPNFKGKSVNKTITNLAERFSKPGFDPSEPRAWKTFTQAIEETGLRPRYDNPYDILAYYQTKTAEAEAASQLVRGISTAKTASGSPLVSAEPFEGAVRVMEPGLVYSYWKPLMAEFANARIQGRPLAAWTEDLPDDVRAWLKAPGAQGGRPGRAEAIRVGKAAQDIPNFLIDLGWDEKEVVQIMAGRRTVAPGVKRIISPKNLKVEKLDDGSYVATWTGTSKRLAKLAGADNPITYANNAELKAAVREVRAKVFREVSKGKLQRQIGNVETMPVSLEVPKALYMHPEVAPVWLQMHALPSSGPFATAFTRANAIAKKMALSFSLFHHGALTEEAIGTLGLKGIPLPLFKDKGFFGKAGRVRPHVKGLSAVDDITKLKELARYHIVGKEVSDAQRTIFKRSVEDLGRIIDSKVRGTFGSKFANTVTKASDWWDHALWDRYHNGLKAYAYFTLKEDMLRRFGNRFTEAQISEGVANMVNNAYGGLNWNKLLISPKMQRQLSWMLLAPDWTLSKIRMASQPAAAAYKSIKKAVGLAKEGGDPIVLALGAKYWRNAIFAQWAFGNMTNKLFSAYAATQRDPDAKPFDLDLEKGHWMHENDMGQTFAVADPRGKDEKGRNRYIHFGKQFREPMRWVQNPFEIASAKTSPMLKIIVEQVSGSTPSGFPMPWKDKDWVQSIPSRAAGMAGALVPISQFGLSDQSFASIAPVGAATTGYKLIAMYKEALDRGKKEDLKNINKLAIRNGFKPKMLIAMAKRDLKREQNEGDRRK